MSFSNSFMKSLNIRHPLVMAPMFLITNELMLKEAMRAGILACFPALNYRKRSDLSAVLESLNSFQAERAGEKGNYGMNIIVQKSNPYYKEHLSLAETFQVPVIITSLGNPAETIETVHKYGGKVFCDVTNLTHAKKCSDSGCDGFVAVGQGAGGHAGPFPLMILIDSLKKTFPEIPVLAGGGIADGKSLLSVLASGAAAGYCGTRFIACTEAAVSAEYKNAIVESGMDDIVLTEKISGTPCTIINTPFAKKIGTKQNWFERLLSRNPKTKKFFKMLIQRRGFTWLEDAVKPGNYANLWCAGQSVEMIHDIKPLQQIVSDMINEMEYAKKELDNLFK